MSKQIKRDKSTSATLHQMPWRECYPLSPTALLVVAPLFSTRKKLIPPDAIALHTLIYVIYRSPGTNF